MAIYLTELPLQTDNFIDELVEICLKLSIKTVLYKCIELLVRH